MTLGLVLTSGLIFLFGLILLALFVAYFAEDRSRYKRIVGSILTVALTGLSLAVIYPPKDTVRLGLDLEGGTSFLIRLMPEQGREIRPDTLEKAVEVIRKRVDQFGVSEPVITPQGKDRILVQIAGLDPAQIEAARQQLGQVAKLEFRAVHPNTDALVPQIEAGLQLVPPGYRIESFSDEDDGGDGEPSARSQEKLLVKIRPEIEGERVRRAFATFEKGYGISLEFDSEGAELFAKYTAEHVGERFAIMLDGKIHSAPVIQTAIRGGHASITGHFTETEATNLAGVLENPLQNPVQIEEERSVSASLGTDSIRSGLYAGAFGLVFTFLFVMIYYRFVGIVANLALIINIILLFGAMILFGSVLTLPGIAGVILSIGMAIDANVLIYERLREEMALGKPLKIAIRGAYDKAFTAIFDANVTTLITSIILFYFATGPVKGFAVTLTFGIIASMFSALLFTRNCFAWLIDTGLVTKVSMWNLIPKTNFDFLGKRNLAIALSVVMTIASIAVFVVRGEKNFGVDFTGGDLLVLEATEATAEGKPTITDTDVRAVLEPLNIDSVVQTERSAEKEFISVRSAANSNERIQEALFAKYPTGLRVEQSDKVGKVVGDELAKQSLVALALGMLGIFIYIAARFEVSFGVAAGLATLHDVIVPIGVFSLVGREVSLVMVGAVLTIAGYSVNDTIVVFDRIREGLAKDSKQSLIDIMNESINDTLSRTLLTGGTTIVAAFALYLFGGPVLNDFAFVILVGLFVAMFSSIFVASPLAYWWMQWDRKRRKHLKTEPSSNPTQA
ncbi:MAG TPA: protein translocase subunit SecD [Chthoniobacteraceae bacterium]|nr:protein translocase subunit SecD [Chthoniobacteraceae bacterium]